MHPACEEFQTDKDEVLVNSYKCAKCGACTTVCPVYQHTGHESLTARGRLHLLSKLTQKKQTSRRFSKILSKCLLCGACYQACPRNIDTPAIIIQARNEQKRFGSFPDFKKFLVQKSLSHPELLPIVKTGTDILTRILPKESGLRLKLAIFEDLGTKQITSYSHSLQPKGISASHSPQIAYFVGCLGNFLQQKIAKASVNCLRQFCETEAIAPLEQTCCGMAATAAGSKKDAVSLAKKNITVFSKAPFHDLKIFTSCATCYTRLKSYPALLANEAGWQTQAEDFAARVVEFSSYLLNNTTTDCATKKIVGKETKVIYHDPCHFRFSQHGEAKIIDEPRKLVNMQPGLSLTEPHNGPQCCGQGGLFNISHPHTSNQICDNMIADCCANQIQVVTTTCSGCLIQIQEGLARHKSQVKAIHLAILLDEMYY